VIKDQDPVGSLLIRASGGRVFYEAKWRDSRRAQRKRRLGPAWLEARPGGGWTVRAGRVKPGHLDERRAHIEMARTIAEHEAELEREPLEPEATFDDAVLSWLDYLEHEKRAKPSTMRGYRTMLCGPMPSLKRGQPRKARLMNAFGGKRLAGIATADVSRFLTELDRNGMTARSVNKHRQVLHSIFEYSKRRDTFGLRENPAADTTRRPEGGAQPIEIFEPAEVMAIAAVARQGLHRPRPAWRYSKGTLAEWRRMNEQDAALFIVAAFTGLRLGELRALRFSDVDFAGARVTVSRAMSWETESSTKSRQMRTVPLAEQVIAELRGLATRERFTGRSDFIFCRPDGGCLDRSAARQRFVGAQKAAGMRVRRFHDLRHTFGSLAIREFDLVAVQSMMGHSKITTTQRYLHSKPRADDGAKLTALFSDGGEGAA
jgi:integrase